MLHCRLALLSTRKGVSPSLLVAAAAGWRRRHTTIDRSIRAASSGQQHALSPSAALPSSPSSPSSSSSSSSPSSLSLQLRGFAESPRNYWKGVASSSGRRSFCRVAGEDEKEACDSIVNHEASASGSGGQDWCAFYINLERRQDRKERLEKLLARDNKELLLNLERIDAVDGADIGMDDPSLTQLVSETALNRAKSCARRGAHTIVHDGPRMLHFDNHLTPGGIACAISHRLAIMCVANHPTAEWGIILEDDIAEVVPRSVEVVRSIIETLPDDWEAIFLGFHESFGGAHPAAKAASVGAEEDLKVSRCHPNGLADVRVRRLQHPVFGLFAWVVRKDVAWELLDNVFPIHGQVDHALSSWLVANRGRTYVVDAHDMVFFSPKSEVAVDSDIQTMLTAADMREEYESFENYYQRMWGLDTMLEDYFHTNLSKEFGTDEFEARLMELAMQNMRDLEEEPDEDYDCEFDFDCSNFSPPPPFPMPLMAPDTPPMDCPKSGDKLND